MSDRPFERTHALHVGSIGNQWPVSVAPVSFGLAASRRWNLAAGSAGRRWSGPHILPGHLDHSASLTNDEHSADLNARRGR